MQPGKKKKKKKKKNKIIYFKLKEVGYIFFFVWWGEREGEGGGSKLKIYYKLNKMCINGCTEQHKSPRVLVVIIYSY